MYCACQDFLGKTSDESEELKNFEAEEFREWMLTDLYLDIEKIMKDD